RAYTVAVPEEIVKKTGFSRSANALTVPADRRLEEFARRLVQSPTDFLAGKDPEPAYLLRLEGVKALRLFSSESNLALVRAWLDDPTSTRPATGERKTLVPAMPRGAQDGQVMLPTQLAHVPEIQFQQQLTKAMKTADAQLHTAVSIDGVNLLNQKRTDGF